jgi:hypothetical protein
MSFTGALSAKVNETPKFSQFHVPPYSGKLISRVDLSSPEAHQFRTNLREGAKKGVNFAGHYTIVTWGVEVTVKLVRQLTP